MYCNRCGREISETVKFCPYCGTKQEKKPHDGNPPEKHSGGSSPRLAGVLIGLVVISLIVVILLAVKVVRWDGNNTQNVPETMVPTESATENIQSEEEPTSESMVPTESQIPEDGWYAEFGKRYYIHDGQRYVDVQEIDGELYYFDEDGFLAVSQDVRCGDIILHSDDYGHIEGMTIDAVFGTWSEETYRFGNGGSSSILELSTEVKNCDSFRFYLESHGLYGAKVNGTWKIYIRHDGKWEFVQDIDYTQPKGYFDIEFEEPKTFDAITAYPTVAGNASYSSLFYLLNVHCVF